MFVQVAVENTAYSFDKPFIYSVPPEMRALVASGKRAMVPFGGGNKTRVAMILTVLQKNSDTKIPTKPILSVLDKEPLLSEEMVALVFWMKSRYYCTLFDAVRLMLPAGIGYTIHFSYRLIKSADEAAEITEAQRKILNFLKKSPKTAANLSSFLEIDEENPELLQLIQMGLVERFDSVKRKIGDATLKMIAPVEDFLGKLSPKQQDVYNTLVESGAVSVKELSYFTGVSAGVIKSMAEKGAAVLYEEAAYRKPKYLKATLDDEKNTSVQLSIEQNRIFDQLIEEYEYSNGSVSLLYGVTGSGKTSVYLKLIDYVIGLGKDVILMVPEISLTPQTIDLFRKKFGEHIAVFHSGLSIGERLDEWKRTEKGECKLAIGTRSAVFAPFKNLGLIVIDEEQEHTYKSETTPRYNAKEIARFRCHYGKGFCLLSSATPSLESYYMAVSGKFGLHKLDVRFGGAVIPEVRLVDMNQEAVFGNTTDISFTLKRALNDNLRQGRQSIVLLNRRGYHTFARCKDCHTVLTCPNCSISLTYHNANNRLMCHYCGYSAPFTPKCPECGNDSVTFSGYGTQRAEEALQAAVPNARVLRIDADSTAGKFSLEKKLDAFSSGEYDIMVGTQMVAKGLDFENVTLVGVISADQSLYSDDFRSNERTFDLLTQVVGRAGRGKYPGQAIIQTAIPENAYLRLAASQDYFTFYEMEITFRLAILYPPFVDILVIGFVGEKEGTVHLAAEAFLRNLSQLAKSEYPELPLRILRPSPATIAKVSGKYRYKLIIKYKNTVAFREMIAKLLIEFAKDRDFSSVTAFADPNPHTID
ncbi:MAG: primosomal protein N' [Oscillospiraceae bacterium]